MTPKLARRGRWIALSGALFVAVGAVLAAPPLVSLGGAVLASLMTAYLVFYPTAVLLRRRRVEMRWWVPSGDAPGGSVRAGQPFSLVVALRNRGPRPMRVLAVDVVASSAVDAPAALEGIAPAGHQVELSGDARARASGHHVLHGAVVAFGDALGLYEARAYFPSPMGVAVLPRASAAPAAGPLARPQPPARAGKTRSPRRGPAGDVREIRDHARGDPWKLIAWKQTARRGKLMVRELDTELVATHQILVDVSGPMRDGGPGDSPLDAAVEAAAGLVRAAVARGDRVGLITFSTRVVSELQPGSGRRHEIAVVDRLLAAQRVYREDETDLTASELVEVVARYLAHQESADVRLHRAPPPGNPAWEHVVAGPTGLLYDLALMTRVVSGLLDAAQVRAAGSSGAARWRPAEGADERAADPRLAALRRLCALRGIELPYRRDSERGARARGLATAAGRATGRSRPDSILLISDLGGVLEAPEGAIPPLARARWAGSRVTALAAPPPRPGEGAADAASRRAAGALADDAALRLSAARRALGAAGIPVAELPGKT